MHPAPSIIVFTIVSGLGYGLAFVLSFGGLRPWDMSTKAVFAIAIVLISTGLLASTFHLGNPQRAWRAFSQWRSSWLSREGCLAVLTFIPLLWVTLTVFLAHEDWQRNFYPYWPSLLLAAGAAATVFCTSMIYTQLKSVDTWHTWLTPACFLGFALVGGLMLASIFAFAARNHEASFLISMAFFANIVVWSVKWLWRERMKRLEPRSTPESSTQLGNLGRVRQFEPPHMTGNYLTNEMMFRVGRKHADRLFKLALALGLILPTLVFLPAAWGADFWRAYTMGAALMTFTLACYLVALGVERWLFFAEARHAVSNFYGS